MDSFPTEDFQAFDSLEFAGVGGDDVGKRGHTVILDISLLKRPGRRGLAPESISGEREWCLWGREKSQKSEDRGRNS